MQDVKANEHASRELNVAMTLWLWLIVVFLLYRLVLYLLYAFNHIAFPFDYDAGEGLILSRAWILAQGGDIYSPISQEPYFVMNYPPVFEGAVALIIKVFGPGQWIGRTLSVGAAGLSGYFLYRITRNLSAQVLSSAVAGLLFFGSCWLTSWSVISRIDTFGLMFALAGLAVITGEAARRKSMVVMAAAVLFSLALFTRQSLIAAPLACVLTGIFSKKKEEGPAGWHKATFLATMLLFPLSVFALLMLVSHGEFYRHTVIYTMGEFDLGNFVRWMREFLELHGVIVFLSLAYVGYCWRRKRYRLAANFWGLALAVSLTAGKEGSSINYFLEFWAANCLMIGLMLGDLARATLAGWKKILGPVVVGILLIQILVLHYRTDFNPVREKYRDASQRLSDYIRLAPGDVLSEYTGYLIQNNKTPIYQPFSMTQLAERGLWDEDVIIQDIRRQRFSLIVMTNVGMAYNRWSAGVQAAVRENYDMVDTLPCYELSYYHSAVNMHVVYKPKETRVP